MEIILYTFSFAFIIIASLSSSLLFNGYRIKFFSSDHYETHKPGMRRTFFRDGNIVSLCGWIQMATGGRWIWLRGTNSTTIQTIVIALRESFSFVNACSYGLLIKINDPEMCTLFPIDLFPRFHAFYCSFLSLPLWNSPGSNPEPSSMIYNFIYIPTNL